MLFKLSNLNSNLALTLGYINPASNNSARKFIHESMTTIYGVSCEKSIQPTVNKISSM